MTGRDVFNEFVVAGPAGDPAMIDDGDEIHSIPPIAGTDTVVAFRNERPGTYRNGRELRLATDIDTDGGWLRLAGSTIGRSPDAVTEWGSDDLRRGTSLSSPRKDCAGYALGAPRGWPGVAGKAQWHPGGHPGEGHPYRGLHRISHIPGRLEARRVEHGRRRTAVFRTPCRANRTSSHPCPMAGQSYGTSQDP